MRLGRAWGWLGVAVVAIVVVVVAVRSEPGREAEPAIKVTKASFDSEAPVTAPAHWLPPEDWVYNHWLPYDEGRLYALLGVSRGAIWRQLRDDRHNLAQLAAKHGRPDPAKLADALVAPRRGSVSDATFAMLRSRALRTLTQGHLSQHLLFHSLHQFSIPSEAPAIFGVTDAEFRALRRAEQSPLEIGRLHGRSPSRIQALSAAVLRERVSFGVKTGAMSARQGRLLLRRQISQLPRWLAQVRYNGPPPTHLGKLTGKPRDFAANPALSREGSHVVFEGYEQKLPVALKRGEIHVLARAGAGEPIQDVTARPGRSTPRSAYNPTVSGDGSRVAYESAEGNLNFAKRYGQIRVFVKQLPDGRAQAMPTPRVRRGVSLSAYNPVISADGKHVAYQAQRRGGQSAVYVTDLRSGRPTLASRGAGGAPRADDGVYDPAISGDGRFVAFTTAASNLGGGDLRGRTQIFVRDMTARTTALVSRASGRRGAVADDYSADAAISRDGRFVAFSSAARNLGGANRGSRVYVRDLKAGRTTVVSGPGAFAIEPSISADGRVVAYTSIARGVSRVLVRDARGRGPERLASRATGRAGATADGPSSDATISADGRRVAFTSAATNLSAGKPDDRRGVFVRNLRTAATTLVSAPVPKAALAAAGAGKAATPGPRSAPANVTPLRSASLPRSLVVSIFDNAFYRSRDRPTVRLRKGGVLTWKWASQQSHQVTLRDGPAPVQSAAKAAGVFSARLRRPGTYEFVCAIHAPGMRMAAVVR